MTETARIAHDEDGIRVDRWFKRHYPALNHGRLEKLLRTGQVRLDGKRVKSADRVAAGQTVRLPPQVVHGNLEERPQAKKAPVVGQAGGRTRETRPMTQMAPSPASSARSSQPMRARVYLRAPKSASASR